MVVVIKSYKIYYKDIKKQEDEINWLITISIDYNNYIIWYKLVNK